MADLLFRWVPKTGMFWSGTLTPSSGFLPLPRLVPKDPRVLRVLKVSPVRTVRVRTNSLWPRASRALWKSGLIHSLAHKGLRVPRVIRANRVRKDRKALRASRVSRGLKARKVNPVRTELMALLVLGT